MVNSKVMIILLVIIVVEIIWFDGLNLVVMVVKLIFLFI